MNLSFATKFPAQKKDLAGKPTNFVEKIWTGFPLADDKWDQDYTAEYYHKFGNPHAPNGIMPMPKIHTIRHDKNERWSKDKWIHFSINPRTKNQFRFAPVIQCTGKERIRIHYWKNSPNPIVIVGDFVLNLKGVEKLATNDGFDSVEDFFKWFDGDFDGWIIHWTSFRYDINEFEIIQ